MALDVERKQFSWAVGRAKYLACSFIAMDRYGYTKPVRLFNPFDKEQLMSMLLCDEYDHEIDQLADSIRHDFDFEHLPTFDDEFEDDDEVCPKRARRETPLATPKDATLWTPCTNCGYLVPVSLLSSAK